MGLQLHNIAVIPSCSKDELEKSDSHIFWGRRSEIECTLLRHYTRRMEDYVINYSLGLMNKKCST
jgi:hypothetical protein